MSAGSGGGTGGESEKKGFGFPGIRVDFSLDVGSMLPYTDAVDQLMLIAACESLTATERFVDLASLIAGTPCAADNLGDNVYVTILDCETCTWFHQARQPGRDSVPKDAVHIVHPADPDSILILRNTQYSLHVIPQGRWEERAGQFRDCAARWVIEYMAITLGLGRRVQAQRPPKDRIIDRDISP